MRLTAHKCCVLELQWSRSLEILSIIGYEVGWQDCAQETFVLMKTSWRCREDVFRLALQKRSSRHLQDISLKRSCQDVFQKLLQDICKTSSRCFQDVFKMSLRHSQEVLLRRLQDVLQKRLQDVFKTSSRGLAKMSSRRFQDVSSS